MNAMNITFDASSIGYAADGSVQQAVAQFAQNVCKQRRGREVAGSLIQRRPPGAAPASACAMAPCQRVASALWSPCTRARSVGTVRLWHVDAGGRAALMLGPLAVDPMLRDLGIGGAFDCAAPVAAAAQHGHEEIHASCWRRPLLRPLPLPHSALELTGRSRASGCSALNSRMVHFRFSGVIVPAGDRVGDGLMRPSLGKSMLKAA